jgi:hypothetical protein
MLPGRQDGEFSGWVSTYAVTAGGRAPRAKRAEASFCDRVRATEALYFLRRRLSSRRSSAREPASLASVNLGLGHPVSRRLVSDAELSGVPAVAIARLKRHPQNDNCMGLRRLGSSQQTLQEVISCNSPPVSKRKRRASTSCASSVSRRSLAKAWAFNRSRDSSTLTPSWAETIPTAW